MKYLKREQNLLKKRMEKVLSAVETSDRLVLEVETELEFVKSGGNYLPAMDDNFLADQIVTFPIVSRNFLSEWFWHQLSVLPIYHCRFHSLPMWLAQN